MAKSSAQTNKDINERRRQRIKAQKLGVIADPITGEPDVRGVDNPALDNIYTSTGFQINDNISDLESDDLGKHYGKDLVREVFNVGVAVIVNAFDGVLAHDAMASRSCDVFCVDNWFVNRKTRNVMRTFMNRLHNYIGRKCHVLNGRADDLAQVFPFQIDSLFIGYFNGEPGEFVTLMRWYDHLKPGGVLAVEFNGHEETYHEIAKISPDCKVIKGGSPRDTSVAICKKATEKNPLVKD